MKKIDLGQPITVVANVGVIMGIVFLAYELRQNTDAVRLNAAQFMASEHATLNRGWMDPSIAELWVQARSHGYESLSDVQKRQWYGLDSSYLQLQQSLFYQWRAGSLDQATWNGRHRQLVEVFQTDNFLAAWEFWGSGANDDFRDYIETVVIPAASQGK